MNTIELKYLAEYLADKVVSELPNQSFDYDYLVQKIILSIENSKI